ncbi:hypothetical protein [uncultured Dokdonia sp.]|uniref:hypothetical protein n=1 Tax=uncultured Dokdonia sp. TaxID=575653 RepID=UPI00261FBF48|nr:hypothetical protein [uncultured Dokdonia sp.]
MKKSILNNIKQIFLIVFSVVLGLFLNERIEESKNEKEAGKLLSKIKSEVKDNKKLIEYWLPYHKKIAKKLDSLNDNESFIEGFIEDESILYKKVLTSGTFMSDMPSEDAWDIAKSHPLIVNFDYEELLILSRVYTQQKMTFDPVSKISEIFLSPDINSTENARKNLHIFKNQMREIVSRESQLLEYYTKAAEILKL